MTLPIIGSAGVGAISVAGEPLGGSVAGALLEGSVAVVGLHALSPKMSVSTKTNGRIFFMISSFFMVSSFLAYFFIVSSLLGLLFYDFLLVASIL
jgi:hypothetical protein